MFPIIILLSMLINYIYKIKRPELRMNERSSLGLPPHWVLRWQDSFPHVCTFGRAAPLIGSFVVCGNHLTPPVYWASSVFGHQNLQQILKAPATITGTCQPPSKRWKSTAFPQVFTPSVSATCRAGVMTIKVRDSSFFFDSKLFPFILGQS